MIAHLLISLRAFVILTIITSVFYPLAITGIAQLVFPTQANGSLVQKDGHLVGSTLLAQKFADTRYFWPRPSAADFATVASGASNQGFTSQKLLDAVTARRTALGPDAPSDLLYASASGLDPHISPESARFKIPRIAAARHLASEQIATLIAAHTEPPQFGFLGQPRVNVLALNLSLDENPR